MGGRRLLGTVLLGVLSLVLLGACSMPPAARVCGEAGRSGGTARPALIFGCASGDVDGVEVARLYRLTAAGATPLTTGRSFARVPAVSPSGTRLAFESTRDGSPTIYVSALDGSAAQAVAPAVGGQTEPSWSPGGDQLVYVSGQQGLHAPIGVSGTWGSLFVAGANGEGARALTGDTSYAGQPAWSPKGSAIAFASDAGGHWAIDTIDPQGGARHVLTHGGSAEWPTWSPKGTEIAYQHTAQRDGGGDPEIWIMDADGRDARPLTEGSLPSWSPDGRWIAFVRTSGKGSNLWMIPATGGRAVRLTDDGGEKGRPTWAAP